MSRRGRRSRRTGRSDLASGELSLLMTTGTILAVLGVPVALGVTYLLTHNSLNAWWLLPDNVALVLN